MNKCPHCEKPYAGSLHTAHFKTPEGVECRRAYQRAANRKYDLMNPGRRATLPSTQYVPVEARIVVCPCGSEFQVKGETGRIYCTAECTARPVKTPLPARICSECPAEFVPFHSTQLTCSQACSYIRSSKRGSSKPRKPYVRKTAAAGNTPRKLKEPRTVTCRCGLEFQTVASRAKYCSDECKADGARESNLRWKAANPEYVKDEKRRTRIVKFRLCIVCDKEFGGKRGKTCSDECSAANKKRLHSPEAQRSWKAGNSVAVGAKTTRTETVYERKDSGIRQCLCGKDFQASGAQKYCSDECRDTGYKRRKIRPVKVTTCLECPKPARPRSRVCSDECGGKRMARQGLEAYAKRRAMQASVPAENVLRDELLNIYGQKCWIGGCEIEGDAFDMDHIVPIIKGGHHIYENLRPACAFHNGQKNDRVYHRDETVLALLAMNALVSVVHS